MGSSISHNAIYFYPRTYENIWIHMSSQDMPKIRIGELSKSIEDDIHELIEWMKSKKISGSVFEISDKWSKHLGMDKHDYNSYRRMSTLLKIAHEKGLLRFEWVASKSPISKKVYQVSPKPIKKQPESDTHQETEVTEVYQLDSRMILGLTRSSVEEKNGFNSFNNGYKGFHERC